MSHLVEVLTFLVFLTVGWFWYERLVADQPINSYTVAASHASTETLYRTCNSKSEFVVLRDL